MKCMKAELAAILPGRYRTGLAGIPEEEIQEIRLRVGLPAAVVTPEGIRWLDIAATEEDLRFCVNAASRYSPWNAATIKDGFLTAPGGHRIGLCGEVSGDTVRNLWSLCIRVAKDFPDLGSDLCPRESTLIIGPPGSGKTTLLRALIRKISDSGPLSVSVVDERGEIFPFSNGKLCFHPGKNTDILSGKNKSEGIEAVLRSMGPGWIAVDEITAQSDCAALVRSGWCGVKLLATAHASVSADLHSRSIYRSLVSEGLFRSLIVMHPDKSYHRERI